MLEPVRTLLDEAVARGDPPSACACAIRDGAVIHESAHNASVESVFDVASITKIATTLAIASLELDLDAEAHRGATVRELLGHRSGLPAWRPFFAPVMQELPELFLGGAPPREAWARARAIVREQLYAVEPGSRGNRVYSDLGFLLLGDLVEAESGEALDRYVARAIFEPLGLSDLGFVDLREPHPWIEGRHVLATGKTRPREPAPGQEHLYRVPPQPLRDHAGAVDDDNAFALAGVAGHAGLFGTARAIASLGAAILAEVEGRGRLGLDLSSYVAIDPAVGPARGLGFDRPATVGSSAGAFGPRAIGHLGFTGCSLWIDLDRRISAALLTNRTYPGRARVEGIRALRPAFHDALVRALSS